MSEHANAHAQPVYDPALMSESTRNSEAEGDCKKGFYIGTTLKDVIPLYEDYYGKQSGTELPKQLNVSFNLPTPMVTFVIGVDKARFSVHENLASAHSPFFRTDFESQLLEGTSPTMVLEDVDPKTFGMLVHFLYTGAMHTASYCPPGYVANAGPDKSIARAGGDFDLEQLAKLWKLAGRVLMPVLQTAALIDILGIPRQVGISPGRMRAFVEYVAAHTAPGSGQYGDRLRRAAVMMVTWVDCEGILSWTPESIREEALELMRAKIQASFPKQVGGG